MNKFYVLVVLFFSFTYTIAQTSIESVSVGAGYSQQAFYDLETGTVTQLDNNAWDIAFSALGATDGGVFINESSSYDSEPLKVYLSDTEDWDTNIDASGFDETTPILYNDEESWTDGAFNSVKNPDNQLDYGWGAYDPSSHQLVGSSIYVIQQRDGSYIKFMVESLSGGVYSIRYGSLDGQVSKTASIAKDDASGGLVYFSFETEAIVTVPEEYDLIFARYSTPLDAGEGMLLDYTVTGVLMAPGVEGVVAEGIDPEAIDEADYADAYSSTPKAIGHEWKSFDFSAGWIVSEDRAQFVKTTEGNVYKITFLDFEGSSTGTTTLEKTYVRTLSSTVEIQDRPEISIYPNPTAERVNIEGLKSAADVMLYDMTGQLVIKAGLNAVSNTLDLEDLSPGAYYLLLKENEVVSSHQVIVK